MMLSKSKLRTFLFEYGEDAPASFDSDMYFVLVAKATDVVCKLRNARNEFSYTDPRFNLYLIISRPLEYQVALFRKEGGLVDYNDSYSGIGSFLDQVNNQLWLLEDFLKSSDSSLFGLKELEFLKMVNEAYKYLAHAFCVFYGLSHPADYHLKRIFDISKFIKGVERRI